MKEFFNLNFWSGFILGILFTIASFFAIVHWLESHPATDCSTCIEGKTP